MASWMEADTKKYCCSRRNDLPDYTSYESYAQIWQFGLIAIRPRYAPPSGIPTLHPSSLAASLSEAVVRLMSPSVAEAIFQVSKHTTDAGNQLFYY